MLFSSTAADLLTANRRSRWSARSAARTYDLDLRRASATIERGGKHGTAPSATDSLNSSLTHGVAPPISFHTYVG
jgi:hypothetical protein